MHIGTKVKPKHVDQITTALVAGLPTGEHIEAIFWANALSPFLSNVVVTEHRLVGVMRSDLASGKGLRKEIGRSGIRGVVVEGSKWGNWKLKIDTGEGLKTYCDVEKEDAAALERYVTATTDSAAPLAATSEARSDAAAIETDVLQSRVIGSVNAKALEEVRKSCRPGELPEWIAGEPTSAAGALAAFSDRCMIIKKGAMTNLMAGSLGGGRVTTFMYCDITAMEYNSGWINGVLEILTPSYQGTANKDFWRGSNKSRNADSNDPYTLSNTLPWTKRFGEEMRPQLDWLRIQVAESKRPIVQVEAPRPGDGGGLAAEIGRLADLHKKGVLDADEFKAAKQRLLASE